MEPVVREVRMAAGNDQIMGPDGAAEILHVLDDYFGPDAVANYGRILGPFRPSSSKGGVADAGGGSVSRGLRSYLTNADCFPLPA